jgi:protein involved in polysaccharide export with SLBB domain
MKTIKIFALVFCVISLTACASAVINPTPLQTAVVLPSGSERVYRVQPGDQLEIKFFYNSELNELVTVRPDGRISLQLASEIMVAGLTPAELKDKLKAQYSKDIDNPEIAVIVRTFSAQRVYVDGEVTKPGLIPLTDLMTALQAISQAGGMKDTARVNEVILIRRGTDNNIMTSMLNLEQALDGTNTYQDIALTSNDIIYVPKSHIANVDVWIDQYIRKILPITPGFALVP